jgi:hypothetical protein
MLEFPYLLPKQKQLLYDLVDAAEQATQEQAPRFIVVIHTGGNQEHVSFSDAGLKIRQGNIAFDDILVLAHHRLILFDRRSENSYRLTLLPEAYLYYGVNKNPSSPTALAAVREVLSDSLKRAVRACRVLEHTAAAYGSVSLPPQIAIELEDKRDEIKQLEKRLEELSQGSPTETT